MAAAAAAGTATPAATTAAAVKAADVALDVAMDAGEVGEAAVDVAEVAEAAPAVAAQATKAEKDASAAVLAAGKAAAADAAAAKAKLAADVAATKKQVTADVGGIKSALLSAAKDIKKAAEGNMPAVKVTSTVETVTPAAPEPEPAAAAAAAAAAPKFDLGTLLTAAQSLNLTQVKGIADKVNDVKEAAGELKLAQLDVKNLTSVLTMLTKLPSAAKGLGIDVKLPEAVPPAAVEQLEKIDVAQVVSLFNTAKAFAPKVNLTGAAETKAGEVTRKVMKAMLWKQKVQAASMQLASSVALGVLTEGVSGVHNVSSGMASQALKAIGMKIPGANIAGAGIGSSMGMLKKAKKELDEELVAKLRRSTELLNDLSGNLQKQAADAKGGFGAHMFVQLCNAKLDQLKLALAGKPVTPGLGESGLLWTTGTLPKPVYAAAPWMKPTLACVTQCKGTKREPVCTGKKQTWGNECLAKCIGARIINPGQCPPVVIGTA